MSLVFTAAQSHGATFPWVMDGGMWIRGPMGSIGIDHRNRQPWPFRLQFGMFK